MVTAIYAAREQPPVDGFSSQQVVAAMTFPDTQYIADFSQATKLLVDQLGYGDVLIVLSAGDADQISTRVLAQIKEGSNAGD